MIKSITAFLVAVMYLLPPAGHAAAGAIELKYGYFLNLTHAHALIAQGMTNEAGKDWFEQRIPGLKLQWVSFNAGPSAMESLFAGTVDITYVGPNPALNAFIRSKGENVRVVSGAVRGGDALLVAAGHDFKMPEDFKGSRIATPQLGNTQDIVCRSWLKKAGLKVTMTGGDVMIIPTPNASMLPLFLTGGIDAAWTVEPWVSRLEQEAGAKIVHQGAPSESVTTILVSNKNLLESHPELVRDLVRAHEELTDWIVAHPKEAMQAVAALLTKLTRRDFPLSLVERAWPRLVFNTDITQGDFERFLSVAMDAGFIKGTHDISGLVITP
jgi:NitT/TauT family transport system substrate-binding protein